MKGLLAVDGARGGHRGVQRAHSPAAGPTVSIATSCPGRGPSAVESKCLARAFDGVRPPTSMGERQGGGIYGTDRFVES
eukprot:scaffold279478_cov28-Tisochrysis_lutea.AAC.1